MADISINKSPTPARKRQIPASALLPPLLFFGAIMIGADFVAIDLHPLRFLRIEYPKAMDYAHFIIPGGCALLWLATFWKWPNASSIVCVLLCFELIALIPTYANRQIVRIPVSRSLTSDERELLKSRIAFPIFERASTGHGNEVFVAPVNQSIAREELQRLGVLPGSGPAAR